MNPILYKRSQLAVPQRYVAVKIPYFLKMKFFKTLNCFRLGLYQILLIEMARADFFEARIAHGPEPPAHYP